MRAADSLQQYPPRAAVVSWIFFDWAAQPYFTLITTFVFSPYFASFVAPDPASGQALWGFATAAAGLMIALMSPVLGAIADASGRRKPWIAGFGALLVIGASLMWIGKPGDAGIIPPLLLAYAIASVGVEFATVFNNAMMPTLVPPDKIGRLSGTGWATGYVGGIISPDPGARLSRRRSSNRPHAVRTDAVVRPRSGHASGRPHHRSLDRHLVHHLRDPMFFVHAGLSGKRRCAKRASRADRAHSKRLVNCEAEIDRDVFAGQHDLHRWPGVAVRVRRHLRGGYLRLAYDPDRHLRHHPGDRRHFWRVARRPARRQARAQTRDRGQHADPAAGDHRDPAGRQGFLFCL